ncbi:MAG TPA: D-2-hydroxyacid dehydrogenase, partial [Bryobacteraceae bacterium]|nr:D-2-hydroxyacid dehydrogenase [Bryobacteraceae bacterium]
NILVGEDPDFLKSHAANADVILNAGPGGKLLRLVFPLAQRVQWVHTQSAGVEKVLFPELIESPAPLTNGRGVFKDSLAEFAIAAILYFAKDLRRLVRSQDAGRWDQFDVEWVRGRTLGIVGYGEIGRETGRLAQALGMNVVVKRRSSPEQLLDIFRVSDYVVVSTPLTEETRGMIGEAELRAMKSTAVIINIARGPVIVESALIAALSENRIKGAALDVFDKEPLPDGHPFYRLENVLLSPHSADHTAGWPELAMQVFVDNFQRFRRGEPLLNVVDKKAGY